MVVGGRRFFELRVSGSKLLEGGIAGEKCPPAFLKLATCNLPLDLNMQTIYIVTTGGAIEEGYAESSGRNEIGKHLKLLYLPHLDIRVIPLRSRDSFVVSQESRLGDSRSAGRDRISLAKELGLLLREENPIVITQRTDTMIDTGLYILREFIDLEVAVILTGAMVPLGRERSDGLQNLTESLLAAQLLGPGVFIVMHGQVFPADRVREDKELGTFVRT